MSANNDRSEWNSFVNGGPVNDFYWKIGLSSIAEYGGIISALGAISARSQTEAVAYIFGGGILYTAGSIMKANANKARQATEKKTGLERFVQNEN